MFTTDCGRNAWRRPCAPPRTFDAGMRYSGPEPVVLDLGKQRRKQIKRLRRGDGKLMDDINGAIAELRTAGTIGAMSQAVVIVVREKRRKAKNLFPLL